MQDIREFCDKIHKDKPDIFEEMRADRTIPEKFTSPEELWGDLKEKYENEVAAYYDNYRKIWKDIV